MEIVLKGETKIVETSVLNDAGAAADLTGATAFLGQKQINGTGTYSAPCTITDSKVSAELDTSAVGEFECMIRVYLNGQKLTVYNDRLVVLDGVLDDEPS